MADPGRLSGGGVVTLDEFIDVIAHELALPTRPGCDAALGDDLGFDSLQMYELLIVVENLGIEVDERAWFAAATLRECYELYCVEQSLGGYVE